MKTSHPNSLASLLHTFFSEYLPRHRALSPHTILSYRDSIALLLRFVASEKGRPVAFLDLEDVGGDRVLAFLDHLERERRNTPSTRNVRLSAIHAFFHFIATARPDLLALCQRTLAIPFKRTTTRIIEYLEYEEIDAVLSSIDRSTGDGRRDYALIAAMFNTGARVSEIVSICARDIQFERPFQVRLFGKGRKERICPLWPQTARLLRELCAERRLDSRSADRIFVNHRGEPLSRYGVRFILARQFERAKATCPTLRDKKLHPHSMRHSTAIHLLRSGVDFATISRWLGHASLNTTNKYTAVDLETKRKAILRTDPLLPPGPQSWRKDAGILQWLESL